MKAHLWDYNQYIIDPKNVSSGPGEFLEKKNDVIILDKKNERLWTLRIVESVIEHD